MVNCAHFYWNEEAQDGGLWGMLMHDGAFLYVGAELPGDLAEGRPKDDAPGAIRSRSCSIALVTA